MYNENPFGIDHVKSHKKSDMSKLVSPVDRVLNLTRN